jgi:hypothetical protein
VGKESSGKEAAMSDLKQSVPLLEKPERNESQIVTSLEPLDRLVFYPNHKLEPHPALIRHRFGSFPEEVAGLENLGGRAFTEPLPVTQDLFIISGWTRWRFACRLGQTTVQCHQRDMTEEEAILEILKSCQRRRGVNDYNRIVMALELEPWLKEQARSNQRLDGRSVARPGMAVALKSLLVPGSAGREERICQ